MFTLYQIVKWSVAEIPQKVYRIGLLFTLGTPLSKQFLLWNSIAPFCCWKWKVQYWIGFWNGPNQVWTLLSEQKLQQNLVLVNDLFKSKRSVANCIMDRASVHTRNASEQFLHHNRTKCFAERHNFLYVCMYKCFPGIPTPQQWKLRDPCC